VLKSGANDRVFIFFTDHGGTGIIAFPDGSLMSSTTLISAIKQMYATHMYSHLVFYMEACESGSMFEGLLSSNIGVYVTTASNAVESSWGTYCPPDDMVNGKAINSCLGDLYSINWMENADSSGPTETLQAQYQAVKTLTTMSHVMQYGDTTWTSEPIGNYLGANHSKSFVPKVTKDSSSSSNVKSADIPMHLAYYKYLRAEADDFEGRQALAKELQQHIGRRLAVDQVFMDLATAANYQDAFYIKAKMPVCDGRCCEKLQNAYARSCGGWDDYSLQYHRVVVNVCAGIEQQPDQADYLVSKLTSMCAQ
jgi:legumain